MIYIVIIFLILFLPTFIKDKKVYCLVISAIFVSLAGLRSDFCGQDTSMYAVIYRGFEGGTFNYLLSERMNAEMNYEFGYFLIQYVFSRFSDFQFFKFCCACIQILPACYIIYKYSNNVRIAFLVYFMLPIFTLLSMSAMRQGIAFGICMIAYNYVMRKDLKRFLILMTIAFFFHNSSIIFVIVYFLNRMEYKRKYNILIFIIWGVLAITSLSVFNFLSQFNRIGYEQGDAGGIGMLIFMLMLFGCSFLIPKSKLNLNYNKYNIFLLVFTIGVWFVGMNLAAVFRLAAYYEFFICLYISDNLANISSKSMSLFVRSLACIGIFLIFDQLVLNGSHEFPVNPYYFFWEQ